jgi:hypothetical protein
MPSDNILKLRELTEKICDPAYGETCEKTLVKIKKIMNDGTNELESAKTNQSKIKYYENLYTKIKNLITNAKI